MPHAASLSIDGIPDWLPSRAFWADFLTSSGFAGVMAVLAASIAGFFVSRQLQQARRQHADQRWWESLKWTYDLIADGEGSAGRPIGPDISVSLLLALQHEANLKHGTRLQRSTIGALAAVFSTTPESDPASISPELRDRPAGAGSVTQDNPPPPSTRTAEAEERVVSADWESASRVVVSPDVSDHLRSLLESAKDESPQARGRLFEMMVHDALATAHPSVAIVRPNADRGFDLIVSTEQGPVAIEVKSWRKAAPTSLIRATVSQLDSTVRASGFAGGVVVLQVPDIALSPRRTETVAEELPPNIVVLQWDGQDPKTLSDAVRQAADGRQGG